MAPGPDSGGCRRRVPARLGRSHWLPPGRPKWRRFIPALTLASDDGSNLYVDGKRVIENDKQHALKEKSGTIKLKTGVHDIRVAYFQGPRFQVALVLRVAGPEDRELRVFDTGEFKPPAPE